MTVRNTTSTPVPPKKSLPTNYGGISLRKRRRNIQPLATDEPDA